MGWNFQGNEGNSVGWNFQGNEAIQWDGIFKVMKQFSGKGFSR